MIKDKKSVYSLSEDSIRGAVDLEFLKLLDAEKMEFQQNLQFFGNIFENCIVLLKKSGSVVWCVSCFLKEFITNAKDKFSLINTVGNRKTLFGVQVLIQRYIWRIRLSNRL